VQELGVCIWLEYIHWSSHYGALVSLIHMFSYVIDLIGGIVEDICLIYIF